ncbi:NUDIX domain-containing protein [Pantoea sp. BAV 3049]|uniref:NUDIX domain-containing protein n=1 Tax=Pantoea sp. BAV 3049 TaxID=2654188 RepID=UPI00131D8E4C|nr:NUDIX domain-containing protein [Pantoea sp. BAV 3049]
MSILVRCAAIIIQNRSLLLVRKPDSPLFMLPGDQPAAGEDHLSCLRRELYETLRGEIQTFRPFGLFFSRDAQGSLTIENHVYQVGLSGQPALDINILAMAWVNHRQPPCEIPIGPVYRDNVMPLLYQQELID